jgi:hypothetical protein
MRVIGAVTIHQDMDPWLSLEALSQYSGLSVRTLRTLLTDPEHPLPHYRIKEPHVITRKPRQHGKLDRKDGTPRKDSEGATTFTVSGKILVHRSEFDAWMQAYRYTPDLDRLVDQVVGDLRQ